MLEMENSKTSFSHNGEYKQVALQQMKSTSWEVKYFPEYLPSYKESCRDNFEKCALRTSLIENGSLVDRSSLFLINLYISPLDQNQNFNPTGDNEIIYIELTVKLVEHPPNDPQMFSSFKMKLHCEGLAGVCKIAHPIYATKPQSIYSVRGQINWTKLKLSMKPGESLYITIDHFIYRHPTEWGISSKAVDMMVKFMCSGDLNYEQRPVLQEIIDKCEQCKLNGVLECLSLQC